MLLLHRPACGRNSGDEVGDRAEDVELDLAVGCIADADRPRAGIAGQRLDHGLGPEFEPFDGVEGMQPLRMTARAHDAPVDPVQERLRLGERAEVDEHARRHRGVAEPAVAVVPVPHAAELLGERHRRCGEDRPGRPMAEAAQCQRAAYDVLPCDVGELEARDPVERRLLRPRLPVLDRVGMGADVVRVEAQLERHVPPGSREVDDGARSVMAAVLEDIPFDAGGEERDRLVVAEHEQPIAERLQLDRHLTELRPGGELEPRDSASGEHPHERRAARPALVVGEPRCHRSELHPPASPSPSPPTSASRPSSCPAGSAARAAGPVAPGVTEK